MDNGIYLLAFIIVTFGSLLIPCGLMYIYDRTIRKAYCKRNGIKWKAWEI